MRTRFTGINKAAKFAMAAMMFIASVFTPAVTAGAADIFPDVPASFWAYDAIMNWSMGDSPILAGYTDGLFHPNTAIRYRDLQIILNQVSGNTDISWYDSEDITREEAMFLIALCLDLEPSTVTASAYADGYAIDPMYVPYINTMLTKGILNSGGKDGAGNFKPKDSLTRAEMVTVAQLGISAIVDTNTSGQTYDKSVIVRKPGVTLSNMTIGGDLIIADGVADGSVILNNVTVKGRTVMLSGGGLNMVNSRLGHIYAKTSDAIQFSSDQATYINNQNTTLYVDGGTSVSTSGVFGYVSLTGSNSSVTVNSGTVTSVNSATGASNVKVSLSGSGAQVETVTLNTTGELSIGSGASVGTFVMNSNGASVKGGGSLSSLVVYPTVTTDVTLPMSNVNILNTSLTASVLDDDGDELAKPSGSAGGSSTNTGGSSTTGGSGDYTVTFDYQDDDDTEKDYDFTASTQISSLGATYSSPSTTTYYYSSSNTMKDQGYSFQGWYTQTGGKGTKVTRLTSDLDGDTLYAYWAKSGGGSSSTSKYTVTFDYNDYDDTTKDYNYSSNTSISSLSNTYSNPDPDDYGYNSNYTFEDEDMYFAGWYTSRNGGSKVTSLTSSHDGDTLYAHWDYDGYGEGEASLQDDLVIEGYDGDYATINGYNRDKIEIYLSGGAEFDLDEIEEGDSVAHWFELDDGIDIEEDLGIEVTVDYVDEDTITIELYSRYEIVWNDDDYGDIDITIDEQVLYNFDGDLDVDLDYNDCEYEIFY